VQHHTVSIWRSCKCWGKRSTAGVSLCESQSVGPVLFVCVSMVCFPISDAVRRYKTNCHCAVEYAQAILQKTSVVKECYSILFKTLQQFYSACIRLRGVSEFSKLDPALNCLQGDTSTITYSSNRITLEHSLMHRFGHFRITLEHKMIHIIKTMPTTQT